MAAIARSWAVNTAAYTLRSFGSSGRALLGRNHDLRVINSRVKSLLEYVPAAPQSTSSQSADRTVRSVRGAWARADRSPPAAMLGELVAVPPRLTTYIC